MRRREGRLLFSPTDLLVYFESPFASWMDRRLVEEPGALTPDTPDSLRAVLIQHGQEHERRYVERMRAGGIAVHGPHAGAEAWAGAWEAMRDGAPAIHGGQLAVGDWEGTPDLLLRVEIPSNLGGWSYVPADCKLGREQRPEYLLQLSAYADMLEAVQGVRPQSLTAITANGEASAVRTSDAFFHYLSVKESFLAFQRSFRADRPPVPDGHADHGRWSTHADRWLKENDHPSRVAGVTRHQVRRLEQAGISTMSALAQSSLRRVPRMDQETYEKLREQASLQIMSATTPRPRYRILRPDPAAPRRGLALLPPESAGDLHFDIEGYPLVDGGLEYLFGVHSLQNGGPRFEEFWAHDSDQERVALMQFLSLAHARFRAEPAMHIFHYGNYEVSALKRLAARYAIAEDKLDDLLRNEVFVDVLQVVRQGLRVGTPAYSLKEVERLYRPRRAGDVATAADSVVQYSRWRATRDAGGNGTSAILESIRDYNRDDCVSLHQLVEWLRDRQRDEGIAYCGPSKRSDDKPFIPEPWKAAESISARLLSKIPADRSTDPQRWSTQELLAHLATFHRRESKPIFWALYARRAMNVEELKEDSDCLGGLRRTSRAPERFKASLVYEYEFDPDQDTRLGPSDSCFVMPDGRQRATVHAVDLAAGRIEIRRGEGRDAPPDELSLIPDEFVDPEPIAASVRRVAESWERTGRLQGSLDHLLHRRAPRLRSGALFRADPNVEQVELVTQTVADLADSCLAVQGPPGTGKTYAAARAILRLVASGQRVAVSANSHAAIRKVLSEVAAVGTKRGVNVRLARVASSEDADEGLATFSGVGVIDFGAGDAPQVVGGTAWALSSADAQDRFDYLFVDEAGQVPLANLVGMAPCARNLVLLGDQLQLATPTRASHPGDSGTSAIAYLLQGHPTVPPELGIFLGRTRRLPERICSVVSDAIYEGRLERDRAAPVRSLRCDDRTVNVVSRGSGIVFVPVEHQGNTRSSDEEVEIVRAVVDDLKKGRVIEDGVERPLINEDIIVVTPYNLQVRALSSALPSLRVGTVDRFQGQQATVVIMSMCASAGEDCARGLDFLFDPHRLNVAVSRATAMAVVVGHPGLTRSRVSSLAQLKRLNLFARLASDRVSVHPQKQAAYASPPARGPARASRAAEPQERHLGVSASNTLWGLDEHSVKSFIESIARPEDGHTWFHLRREAETLALTPSFDRLITLEFNAIKELPHQIAVARQVLKRPMAGRAILADEVGLGKTIEAGIVLKELAVRGLARRVLILAPAALVEQWREELLTKFFEKFSTPAVPDDWQHCTRAVVSYDRARQKDHKEAILRHQWDLVIVDEAHKVKNHQTITYQALKQVHRNFLLLLTATPLQNSLRELYNLVTLLRPGQLGTWDDFRRRYVQGGDPRKAKNPEALRELTSQVMVRTRRANVASTIQLPPRRPRHPRIQLTAEESDLYQDTTQLLRDLYRNGFYQPDEAEEEADRVRRKRYTGKGNLSRMMILLSQRLCSSPQALSDSLENLAEGEHILPEYRTRALKLAERARRVTTLAKLEALTQLLRETGDRVIVFTDHLPTLKLIEKRVSALGRQPIVYAGSVSRHERNERLVHFKRTDGAVFITTRAGGEGLNLQFCSWLVNYELPWNPMVVEQRIGRIHRIGQEREVQIVNFAAQGTIEAHVLRLLDEKIKLFELVVGELDVILGKFGEPEDLEKQLRNALLSSKDDAEFEEKLTTIGAAIADSREEGLKQEQAASEVAAEDAGTRLAQEFSVLSIPARIRLGYGTVHLKLARGVEVKRHQLALRVPEIIEALDVAHAEPAGRHVDYGSVHRVSGRTGRGRAVSLLVKADSLPMVLADIDATPESGPGSVS